MTELEQIHDRLKELSAKINLSSEELIERINLTVHWYNIDRNAVTDDQISKTRMFLSSDLYRTIEVCYEPALDDLISAEINLSAVEAKTFREGLEEYTEKGYSKSQAIEVARKIQKENPEYQAAFEDYVQSKKIVNIYDKVMKIGSQVLNSMARRNKD